MVTDRCNDTREIYETSTRLAAYTDSFTCKYSNQCNYDKIPIIDQHGIKTIPHLNGLYMV